MPPGPHYNFRIIYEPVKTGGGVLIKGRGYYYCVLVSSASSSGSAPWPPSGPQSSPSRATCSLIRSRQSSKTDDRCFAHTSYYKYVMNIERCKNNARMTYVCFKLG